MFYQSFISKIGLIQEKVKGNFVLYLNYHTTCISSFRYVPVKSKIVKTKKWYSKHLNFFKTLSNISIGCIPLWLFRYYKTLKFSVQNFKLSLVRQQARNVNLKHIHSFARDSETKYEPMIIGICDNTFANKLKHTKKIDTTKPKKSEMTNIPH